MRFAFEDCPFESPFVDETGLASVDAPAVTRGTIQVRANDRDPQLERLRHGEILRAQDGVCWRVLGSRSSAYEDGTLNTGTHTLETEEATNRNATSQEIPGVGRAIVFNTKSSLGRRPQNLAFRSGDAT